jgi:ribonucleoside-diphosphate reductase alpha chain
MKIQRFFTDQKTGPYHEIVWERRKSEIRNPDGKAIFSEDTVIVPAFWSQIAADIIAQKYFRKAGVPADKIYEWKKWLPAASKEASDSSETVLPEDASSLEDGAEHDARQVFHRLAFTWMDWGRRNRYFDSDEDAKAFYDEVCYMLARQFAAPNSPQWFNTGLYAVYGIDGPAQGHYYFDPAKNEVVKSDSAYKRPQPHACFILSIEDDLVNDGGIMDLVTREARLFKYGSGTGSNFSRIRGMNEHLSGGGVSSGLLSFLKIGDRSASAIKSGGTTRRAAKMVTLDVDHPDVEKYISWKADEEHKVASMVTGSAIVKKHLDGIKKALASFRGPDTDKFNIEKNHDLAAVLRAALGDKIPASYLYQQLRRMEHGDDDVGAQVYSAAWDDEAYNTVSGQSSNNSLRINDEFMWAVMNDGDWNLTSRTGGNVVKTIKARKLWTDIARSSWQCADPGLQYHTTINDWHTCPAGGEIRASNPCSEYMFLDDTACNLASINLGALYDKESKMFSVDGCLHAIGIWTTVLEISVVMAQFPSPKIAELSYQYRTLGLGYANLGTLLMLMGLAYDSAEGRAVAGALSALLSGEAYSQSARMAAELGPFLRYKENSANMLRVIRNHRRAAYNSPDAEYEDLHTIPCGIDEAVCPAYLLDAARAAWDRALELGKSHGYRNAQVSAIAPTGTIGLLMDCDTTGVEPDYALVKFKKLAGGGYFKIINQSVPPALEALGYSPQSIEEIIAYATGYKTLSGAPSVNPDTLKAKGFTQEAIAAAENAVKTALDLEGVFTPWTLGRDFVEKILHIPESTWSLQGFSLLKHIGFSAEDIAEAELYACGTMGLENAPGLKNEHYAVFDTAMPSGKNGKRSISWTAHIGMMAAVQPFISGAISKTINMPNSANYEDVKGAYMLSWKKALKAVALYRDGSKLSQPLSSFAPGTDPLADTVLKIEKGLNLPMSQTTPQVVDRKTAVRGLRRLLPSRRTGYTQKAKISNHTIYIRTGEYEDGSLGEIFLDMHREGAAFRSLLNSFAITVSLGLQYGVSLEEYVDALTFSKFEPNGPVQGHDYVKMTTSVIDYIFRDLAISYLKRYDLGQVKPEDLVPTATKSDIVDSSEIKQRISEKQNVGFKPYNPPASGVAGASAASGSSAGPEPKTIPPGAASSGLSSRGDGIRALSTQTAEPPVQVLGQSRPEQSELYKIAQARIKGYEGDPCPSCGSFTLIRNGTCMKCQTCGGTTGCS